MPETVTGFVVGTPARDLLAFLFEDALVVEGSENKVAEVSRESNLRPEWVRVRVAAIAPDAGKDEYGFPSRLRLDS